MACRNLILTLILSASGLLISASASAGIWGVSKEPAPWRNHLGRRFGLGWSDGYHAHGSLNSWSPCRGSGHDVWHPMSYPAWAPADAAVTLTPPQNMSLQASRLGKAGRVAELKRLPPVQYPQR